MHHHHLLSLGLIITGSLLLALSVVTGLDARVESTLWVVPATPASRPLSSTLSLEASPVPTATPSTRSAYPFPVPTAPISAGADPVHLAIPSIGLDAPVVPVTPTLQRLGEQEIKVWPVPDFKAVGWQVGSARPGGGSNIVLNGHNTTHGEVFRTLYRIQVGALIELTDATGKTYTYRVSEIHLVSERDASPEQRLENARFILPTPDERLTLVTCHPYGSTRYRLIVIARPYSGICTRGCS